MYQTTNNNQGVNPVQISLEQLERLFPNQHIEIQEPDKFYTPFLVNSHIKGLLKKSKRKEFEQNGTLFIPRSSFAYTDTDTRRIFFGVNYTIVSNKKDDYLSGIIMQWTNVKPGKFPRRKTLIPETEIDEITINRDDFRQEIEKARTLTKLLCDSYYKF
ncbi:MAG: hypothetical protein ACOC2U_03450 [bacterium]